jgi:hypothetical protein
MAHFPENISRHDRTEELRKRLMHSATMAWYLEFHAPKRNPVRLAVRYALMNWH